MTGNPNAPVPVEIRVQVYALSARAVLHRSPLCDCDPRQAYPRPWRTVHIHDLADLVLQLWPHRAELPLRENARRFSLGHCDPRLPMPLHIRTLLKEPPMPPNDLLVALDATGKHTVHAPGCSCIGGIRAQNTGTGVVYQADSVEELAALAFPGVHPAGRIQEIAQSEFEVKPCLTLPLKTPAPAPYEDRLARAVLRAHSALVSLATTAETIEAEKTRDLHHTMDLRMRAVEQGTRRPRGIILRHLEDYIAATGEAAAWTQVREDAEERAGECATDQEKAEAWVIAAQRQRSSVVASLTRWAVEDQRSHMDRAFSHNEARGQVRFLRNCEDALHEVGRVAKEGDSQHRARLGM